MTTDYAIRPIRFNLDVEGRWMDPPDRLCNMLDRGEKELKKQKIAENLHPEEREKIQDLFEELLSGTRREFEVQTRFLDRAGKPVSVYICGTMIRDEQGEPEYLVCYLQDLSRSREIWQRLEESEQRFRSLFRHNPHPVYYFDLEGNFEGVNDKLVEFTGYSREELLKMNFESFIVEEDLERTIEQFEKAAAGESGQYEIRVVVKGDEMRDIRVTKFPMYVGERITGVFGILQDVTEQKRSKKKLQESELRFRSMFENNPHSVFYFNREGKFMGANKKFEELSGFSEEELRDKTFEPFIHPDDFDETRNHFERALAGEVRQYEITGITRDGEERQVFVTNFPDVKEDEHVGVFGICEDITARKAANIRLKRSEQRFKSLFERNPHAVFSFDLEGNFLQANEALEELTGYTTEELRKLNFEPLTAHEDKDRVREYFQKAARGEPQTYEATGVHKDGHRFRVQVTDLPIYVDGKIEGVFGIAHDITEEREAQRRLKDSEERWHRLVENNPQPVQIVQEGKIVFINEVGTRFYGAENRDELVGKPILDFIDTDHNDLLLERLEKLEQGENVEPVTYRVVLLDGEERYVEAHSIAIRYKGEKAIQTVFHDITRLKEKQELIGQSLREKEVLLQEIHHRVKNNLAVISGLLELQSMNTTDETTVHALKDSQLRIHSMAMIHEKLYQSEALSDISFDAYLKELVRTISGTYRSESKTIEYDFELDSVSLDINQAIPCSLIINEVIVNCYKHAFPQRKKGNISIELDYDRPELYLKIADDGQGLPEAFDIGEQQSLGMTLVQTLNSQLGGDMRYRSDPGDEGTVFTLRFETE